MIAIDVAGGRERVTIAADDDLGRERHFRYGGINSMFVYPTTVYRTIATQTFELMRHCSGCGRNSLGRVNALSESEAEAPFGLTNQQALAGERANQEQLPLAAQANLDLAACPHCSAREQRMLRSARRHALFTALVGTRASIATFLAILAAVLIALLIALDSYAPPDDVITPLGLGLAIGAVWFLVVRASFRKRLRRHLELADAMLVWLVPGASPAEHATPEHETPPPARASNDWPFA